LQEKLINSCSKENIYHFIKKPFSWHHGKKGFVIPTKSFVKIGTTKKFCYNNKMFSSISKASGCCSKVFGCSNKKFICCP